MGVTQSNCVHYRLHADAESRDEKRTAQQLYDITMQEAENREVSVHRYTIGSNGVFKRLHGSYGRNKTDWAERRSSRLNRGTRQQEGSDGATDSTPGSPDSGEVWTMEGVIDQPSAQGNPGEVTAMYSQRSEKRLQGVLELMRAKVEAKRI